MSKLSTDPKGVWIYVRNACWFWKKKKIDKWELWKLWKIWV